MALQSTPYPNGKSFIALSSLIRTKHKHFCPRLNRPVLSHHFWLGFFEPASKVGTADRAAVRLVC